MPAIVRCFRGCGVWVPKELGICAEYRAVLANAPREIEADTMRRGLASGIPG